MKRFLFRLWSVRWPWAVTGVAVWCDLLYVIRGSVGFWCGRPATPNEQYLDASGRAFQRGSWHLGNGTRTWGETYGVKVGRVYVTMGVKHTNLRVTSEEADE